MVMSLRFQKKKKKIAAYGIHLAVQNDVLKTIMKTMKNMGVGMKKQSVSLSDGNNCIMPVFAEAI